MNITTEFVMVVLAILGSVGALWARIESRVEAVRKDALISAAAAQAAVEIVRKELAEHQIHVAATYITRELINIMRSELLAAMYKIGDDAKSIVLRTDENYKHITARLDSIIDRQSRQD